jgi:hypothetical protein
MAVDMVRHNAALQKFRDQYDEDIWPSPMELGNCGVASSFALPSRFSEPRQYRGGKRRSGLPEYRHRIQQGFLAVAHNVE